MRCPNCAQANIGRIDFSLVGSGASFHYCRECEHRWWSGGVNDLDEVLRAATVLARAS